jgi:UDP-glucose 4-epimerase
MQTVLITGGAGFFGGILARMLLDLGYRCVSLDLYPHDYCHPNLTPLKVDIQDRTLLNSAFDEYQIDVVFHCAAIMAHGKEGHAFLWSTNVGGTRNIAELARQKGVRRVVFISTNCLWTENLHRPIREDDAPAPVEIYGKSKLEGERILQEYNDAFVVNVLRCPAIIDSGRLGLFAILFEFMDEGRRIWTVGRGDNRYQFVYGRDAADACIRLLNSGPGTFHVGADHTKPLRDIYQYVIDHAGSSSRIASLPKGPALFAMKAAYKLGISPLPSYFYKMIAEDFEFDNSKAKRALGWRPTLTNEEMLLEAYLYYRENKAAIHTRRKASAHRQATKMGVIRLLKIIS